jgi:hypothetical protein
MPARMSDREWMWAGRNLVAVLAAILLAAILSHAKVFRDASLGGNGFSAAEVVRLVGWGTALALIWISAWNAAAQLPASGPVLRLLRHALPPLATLVILPAVYGLLHPFLRDRAAIVFSWIFVLLLIPTAVWLGLVLHENADALLLVATKATRRISAKVRRSERTCQTCGKPVMAEAKFCGSCGAFLPQATRGEDRSANAPAEKRPPSGATGPA